MTPTKTTFTCLEYRKKYIVVPPLRHVLHKQNIDLKVGQEHVLKVLWRAKFSIIHLPRVYLRNCMFTLIKLTFLQIIVISSLQPKSEHEIIIQLLNRQHVFIPINKVDALFTK